MRADDAPVTRPDLDAVLAEARQDSEGKGGARAILIRRLADALAAERARADKAEQRIEDAPHDAENCELVLYPEVGLYPGGDSACTCWKFAAPTAEQGADQ